MKKLLLLSLLTMGATSFAAVEGTTTRAEMPITVRGSVIAKTGTNLIIEPIKNAGVSGTAMEFDFGGILQGENQALQGTFAIYRATDAVIDADIATKVKVGLLDEAGTGTKATDKTEIGTGDDATNKVVVNYAVASTATPDNKRINGSIDVNVTVGSGVAAGSFLDTTKKLAVIITPTAE